MHIPDGFLEPKVWIPLAAISGAAVATASKKISKNMDERMVPLMGVLAAFVFAAQMVNFPIGGGTSGHLMGGVLIAAILGPHAALLIMATILILQALLFQDGGITALGANIFNMGVVGALSGYVIFKGINRITGSARFSVFVASWFSVVAAASIAAVELSLSGVVPLKASLPAMAGVHAVIGIGEGAVTIAALELISKVNREAVLVQQTAAHERIGHKTTWIWLAVSFAVAMLLAPFASEFPDGLEKVAETFGFIERGTSKLTSPLPDYQVPGLSGGISTAMAGIAGVLITFIVAYMAVKVLHKKR
jgi:cobalt/nickel transport system permease protein